MFILVALCSILVPVLLFLSPDESSKDSLDDFFQGVDVQRSLAEHGKEFDSPKIVKVTDGVYVAVGFALANSILLEGRGDEAVVVDVTESVTAARTILTEFRKLTSKRITDIVFTHNHADHVFGAEGFIEKERNPNPDIWAFHSFGDLVQETRVVGPRHHRGFIHQMGLYLGKYLVNSGVGPSLMLNGSRAIVPLSPNKLIYKEQEVHTLAGLNITFIHIPGETEDQMAVWLPDKRVLLPADDVYKTFPNLYAIRGTRPRNAMTWHESLKRMRTLRAEHLVPSHTQPVSGRRRIYDVLTTYMAAIQYVHDQTVRHMNAGLHPDEISGLVSRLPDSLSSHPYLQQFYGNTIWSSKGVYENYVGWFSGDPVDLLPLSPAERSRRMVKLVGAETLLREASSVMEKTGGDLQWGLELISHVFRIDPENRAARRTRHAILRKLSGQQSNPIGRNFYMTTILDDHGWIDWKIDRTQIVEKLPIKDLLQLMRYQLKAENSDGLDLTVVIRFSDTAERHRLQIIHSILEVNSYDDADENDVGYVETEENDVTPDVTITTTTTSWRKILLKRTTIGASISSGEMLLEPAGNGLKNLGIFFSCFQL